MSKIEANKFDISLVEFDFEKMLRNVVDVVNFRVSEKWQELIVHIDENIPPRLIGDDQRIAQVVANLMSNAVKFTPEQGFIRLAARLVHSEKDMRTVEISVSDTGIGISVEQQKRLFQPFEQAESGTSRKFGGTGLGLTISKRIIDLMGGDIKVESELGKGSVFSFTLKLQSAGDQEAEIAARKKDFSSLRILAVDDRPDAREFFSEIAARFSLKCDSADSGARALAMVEENGCYDICFVDKYLLDADSIELCGRIREICAEAVIIMVSSADSDLLEQEAKAAGVNKFISKPIFPSSIIDCMNECLIRRRGDDDSGKQNLADDFSGYRLLLVEDVEINREIVFELLAPTGIEISFAENGVQALKIFTAEQGRYDMIFMDVQMPEMDGYEASRRIRALNMAGAATVPIVAMTANVFREDIEKCLESGMDDHVGKPLDFDLVLAKMRKYIKPRNN
jgi:CheY-like chemotaxis protein/anti-sigma regulatory factor (Ser/Thr protein kinase)